jgi:hypothetical protein
MTTGPVVDTPSALEFQREIMDRVSETELQGIAADLGRKSSALRELLSGEPSSWDRATLRQVLRWLFATRRRADQILDSIGPGPLAAAISGLFADGDPVADRVDRFDAALSGRAAVAALGGSGFDLPAELLHFTSPERYWLWTRWIWDPDARTGALALITTDDADLGAGATRGAVYLSVGRATAFVDETGKAAGFTAAGPGLFGADVLLAAVYGVYMYTVLQMRLTREFNQVVPALPHLVRRLLGVYHLEG